MKNSSKSHRHNHFSGRRTNRQYYPNGSSSVKHLLYALTILNADETYHYYTLQHANADWTVSELFKSEYINGFDDVRITEYDQLIGDTAKLYTLRLTIPNRNTEIITSGNYILAVFDDNQNLNFYQAICRL